MSLSAGLLAHLQGEITTLRERDAELQREIDAFDAEMGVIKTKRDKVVTEKAALKAQAEKIEQLLPGGNAAAPGPTPGAAHSVPISEEESPATPPRRLPRAPKQTAYKEAQEKYVILNAEYPTILRIDGKVFAISCFVGSCRANAQGPKDRGYFRGILGLHNHVRQAHPGEGKLTVDETAEKCTKVELDEGDIVLVEAGEEPESFELGMTYSTIIAPYTASKAPKKPIKQSSGGKTIEGPISNIYTHIVQVDGVWMELSCRECKANATLKDYFKGLSGIQGHLRLFHNTTIPLDKALEWCNQRQLSALDVSRMHKDEPRPPIDRKIEKIRQSKERRDAEMKKEKDDRERTLRQQERLAQVAAAKSSAKPTEKDAIDLTNVSDSAHSSPVHISAQAEDGHDEDEGPPRKRQKGTPRGGHRGGSRGGGVNRSRGGWLNGQWVDKWAINLEDPRGPDGKPPLSRSRSCSISGDE